jgi:hypothetical protein
VGTVGEGKLVGHMKSIGGRGAGIEEADIALAPLGLHKDGLETFEVFPRLQVSLNVWRDAGQALDYLFSAGSIYNAGIEPLQLADNHIMQHHTLFAASEADRVVA